MTTNQEAWKILAAIVEPEVEKTLEKDKTTNKEADQDDYSAEEE